MEARRVVVRAVPKVRPCHILCNTSFDTLCNSDPVIELYKGLTSLGILSQIYWMTEKSVNGTARIVVVRTDGNPFHFLCTENLYRDIKRLEVGAYGKLRDFT